MIDLFGRYVGRPAVASRGVAVANAIPHYRMPVHERQWVRHLIAVPASGASAYAYGAEIGELKWSACGSVG